MSVELKGTVEKVTYRNSDNGYTVFKLIADKDEVFCVGYVPSVTEGDEVVLTGDYTVHPSYGEQFEVESIQVSLPKTKLQILRFLSSGAIKGVGPATAIKIVERFKDNSLDIIENFPLELTTIKGITRDKALAISEEYKNQFGVRDIMLQLSMLNITPVEATDIFKTLGCNSVSLIKENPYLLCSEGIGFGFDRVEEISEALGHPPDSDGRVSAGLEYVIRKNLSNGHTCLPFDKVVRVAHNLLSVNENLILDTIKNMCDRMQLVIREYEGVNYIFLREYYAAEEYIASKINSFINNNYPLYSLTEPEIKQIQSKFNINFEDKQLEAVNGALANNIYILTGGPGTGKTTTLNALIHILKERNLSIALCAPTGRAAKRITELTEYDAKTLHRLLEVEWGKGNKQVFARNHKRPLDEDVIIIDEVSMVDTLLFKALLEACRVSSRIIIVGDSDQLPSVGAGNVLSDLLQSGKIKGTKLDKIFRQSGTGDIVKNAHNIICGQHPQLKNDSNDFFFMRQYNPDKAAATALELVTTRLPSAYGFSSIDDIQILCPSKKGICGSLNINLLLQEALNPVTKKTKQIYYKGISFRVGDKVMQTKNDYDIIWNSDLGETGSGIFNGDIGKIIDVDPRNKIITIRFEDKTATYFESDFDIIELAYAITVHKSQGSEFDCVIIPLCDTPKLLRYRNLIYTAITRAKKILVFVGNESLLYEMIDNDRKTLRYSGLRYMLENYD